MTDTGYTFIHLNGHVLTLQNRDTLMKKGENMYQFVLDHLLTNDDLHAEFQHMFAEEEHDIESRQTSVIVLPDKLFKEIGSLFSRVKLKQLRKDFLAEVTCQKKQAHRKAIMTGPGRAANPRATVH